MRDLYKGDSERCGIVYCGEFVELQNSSKEPVDNFELDLDYGKYQWSKIEAIVHSHIDGTNHLSTNDRIHQVRTGKNWILVTKDGVFTYKPVDHLRGRNFEYGVSDCATLIEDAYHLAGINLTKLSRGTLEGDDKSLKLLTSLPKLGFSKVKPEELAPGDVICTGNNGYHLMLYVGNELVVHHAFGQFSRQQAISSTLLKSVNSIWRHRDWNDDRIQAILADLKTSTLL